jgi:Ketosteroid isomerase-related protein
MTVKSTIEAFWKGHSTQDIDLLKTVMAEDMTWTVVGKTCPIAKSYEGWDGFFGELLTGLGEAFKPGTLKMTVKGLYADEEAGMGFLHLAESAELHNGKMLDVELVDVFTVKDGKIVDVREIMDMAAVNMAFGFGEASA